MKDTLLRIPSIIAFAATLLTSSALATEAPDSLAVTWKGDSVPLIGLAERGPAVPGLVGQLERYRDWVLANDYQVSLSNDGRVILITESTKVSKRRMKLVEAAIASFDSLMAPPDRTGSTEKFQTPNWGAGQHKPDAEPIVLIEVRREGQFKTLCEGLVAKDPSLTQWVSAVAGASGFSKEGISTAAWQEAPSGVELGTVWRPQNEMVNRLARLLLYRSYGPQPTWMSVASAWHVELDVMKNLYCFPYRDSFVSIGDHSGWKKDLKRTFKGRKKKPLEFEEIGAWRRNTWTDEHASLSWGLVEFLAYNKPGTLPALAESFRLNLKAGSVTTQSDGSWTMNPSYQVPLTYQLGVLRKQAGDQVMEELSDFLGSGMRVKKKSSKRRKR